MTPRRFVIAVVLAAAALWAPAAVAQTTWADFELGYQWVDVSGNEDMYRTQLNEDDGFVIRDLSLVVVNPDGTSPLFDRLRIDADGFGGSPAGRFRLSSDLAGAYSLKLSYLEYDAYSALTGWANPELADGVTPGLHTSERDRRIVDVEIEVLPGHWITPIIGYRWNEIEGARRSTYHVGQDEFRVDSDLTETEEEFRLGAAFRFSTFRGAVIQGWRSFESRDAIQLAAGGGDGLNDRPVLGTNVQVDQLTRTVRTKADTPVTSAYLSGTAGERVRLSASYVRADTDSDTFSDESASGSLVSFAISRFYSGLDESIESRTENPSWRGAVRAAIDFSPNVTVDLGYQSRHRELQGWALISSLYLDTLNFSGADPKDLSQLTEIANGYERDDDVLDITVRASNLGPFHFWAGWMSTDSTLDVSQDVAEIVIPGNQSGRFERKVSSHDLGAGVTLGSFRFVVDYRVDDAEQAVLRTDYIDRSRLRGRVDWSPLSWLTVGGTAERIDAENTTPEIGYDAETDHWSLDLDLHPVDDLSFRFAWDEFSTDSVISIRRPQDFGIEPSVHAEDGEMIEGSLRWHVARFTLWAGYSSLDNDGSLPFELERTFGRISCDFSTSWGASVEYESNEYSEALLPLSDFDAERYAVFVRWRK